MLITTQNRNSLRKFQYIIFRVHIYYVEDFNNAIRIIIALCLYRIQSDQNRMLQKFHPDPTYEIAEI